ncbi:MAG: aldehyde dehydrogenase family protein, partial [Alphaproteobacteria bacterium]
MQERAENQASRTMAGDGQDNEQARIDGLISHARAAMRQVAGASQEQLHDAATALAWSLYEPARARALAELAVETTGLGNVESKIIKNQRKTFGTLRDLLRAKTTGIIEEQPERGLVKYAKPVGVVAAVTPSTNPSATPVNKAMMAVVCGNAIIIAPSPLAWTATNATVEAMRAELRRIDMPEDLVQILPKPVSREATRLLMASSDLVVTTGSQNNVRAAYSSGTPAIGVGAGNVPVIID